MNDKQKKDPTGQEALLALQRRLAPRTRATDIALIVLLLAVLYGFAVAAWALPDRSFSEQENRVLQTLPALSSPGKFADRLVSGKFTSEVAKYYADQFPLRDTMVGVKAAVMLAAGRRENNSVIDASGDYIIERSKAVSPATVSANTAQLSAFAVACATRDIPFTAALAPRSADALAAYIAAPAPEEHTGRLRALLAEGLSDAGYLDLYDPLVSRVEAGEDVYYRTDHHWTTLGAYYAYAALAEAWGDTAAPLSSFTPELASDAFYGTTWSRAGMKWTPPDALYFYRYEGDGCFRTVLDGREDKAFTGFYDREYLSGKDKYGAFLSGNNGRVSVRMVDSAGGEVPGRETLLILKDSFAHALVPFLAQQYNLEIIDLRYYKKSVLDLLDQAQITRVLALYNYDSFLTDNAFGMLRLTGLPR